MKILIITPARPGSQTGNRVTAIRWSRVFRQLGHQVSVAQQYDGQASDVMVAIHARRSATAIERFRREPARRPLILLLSGTDLYRDIRRSRSAQRSLQLADRLILLQPHGTRELSKPLRRKVRVIYQSVPPLKRLPAALKQVFEVAVVGHLRPVKDPFRAAMAARRLPDDSKIRIVHMGGALSESMERRARSEMARNARYHWLGELPRGKMLQRLARSRLLVLSSKLEGGANVISEAVVADVPVLSSRISGSLGLLGEDYPGYFEVGDTRALTRLLERAESDRAFLRRLSDRCRKLKPLFDPSRELESWQALFDEL